MSSTHVDMKLEYLKQVEKLEEKRDDLKMKYQEISKASENSWEDIKEGTENVWNDLKESLDKAIKYFKY